MNRDKAIEAMDALVESGYNVTLHAHYMGDRYVGPDIDFDYQARYSVSISEISVDKMDVKALVEIADELELDIGYTPMRGSGFSLGSPQQTPEEAHRAAVASGPRRHPKKRKK